ncbi:hypothetical protein GIS00_14550 [Nakamurella sp. YIM 132087]|uniref:Uncharacterized protein n=1 Tax=Nakamurella alba TaxID=2665158 RepID=A0A7K1FLY2_9ACTN|nr:hypothetical protein [Nakamurella alba]MTD15161.1 hypothetical protein [Nakamurella alba]
MSVHRRARSVRWGSLLTSAVLAIGLGSLIGAVASAAPAPQAPATQTPTVQAAPTQAGAFGPIDPVRLLDTRTGNGAPKARLAPGASITVTFTGRGGIPTTNVSTVVAAVTVVTPSGSGTLSIAPNGKPTKRAVIINFGPKQGISSTAFLPIGTGGKVVFTNNSGGTIDLVADTTGYYRSGTPTTAGAFGPIDPVRLIDTRTGNGTPKTKLAPGATIAVTLTGRGNIPASNVSTVAAALTVVGPVKPGTLSVAPNGAPGKRAVVINFTAGRSISSTALLPVGTDGKVLFTNNSGGTIDVVADTTGYYRAGAPTGNGTYGPIDPVRLLDTRTGNGTAQVRLPARASINVTFTGRGGIPATGVSTVAAALTVVSPAAGGTLSVAPNGNPTKRAVVINFAAAQGISSTALLPVGAGGGVVLTNNSTGPIDLVADVTGYDLDIDLTATPTWDTPDPVYHPLGDLRSVSCTSTAFCMATDGVRTLRYDGTWHTQLLASDTTTSTALPPTSAPPSAPAVRRSGTAPAGPAPRSARRQRWPAPPPSPACRRLSAPPSTRPVMRTSTPARVGAAACASTTRRTPRPRCPTSPAPPSTSAWRSTPVTATSPTTAVPGVHPPRPAPGCGPTRSPVSPTSSAR